MFDLIIIQHHQHQGYGNSVVPAKRRSICRQSAIPDDQIQSIFFKIMLYPCTLLADHIHMTLKHNRCMILCPSASRFFNDYIISIVLDHLQTSVLCKFHKIITDSFFISRTSWDRTDLFKEMK